MEILKKSYIGNMELNNRIFLAPVTTEKDWKVFFSKKTKKFIEKRADATIWKLCSRNSLSMLDRVCKSRSC